MFEHCLRFLKLPEAFADRCLVTCVTSLPSNDFGSIDATHLGVAATTLWRSNGRIDEQ